MTTMSIPIVCCIYCIVVVIIFLFFPYRMKVEDVPAKSASAKLLKAVKMKQECKSPGGNISPYNKPPALSKPSSISSSTPPSHSSLIFGSAATAATAATAASDTDGSSSSTLPAMPALTGQPSPKSLNPLDMRIPGYKNIAPAPPKLSDMSPKIEASPVKSVPREPADVELSLDVLSRDNSSEKDDDDDEEGVLIISEQDETAQGENADCEISAEVNTLLS